MEVTVDVHRLEGEIVLIIREQAIGLLKFPDMKTFASLNKRCQEIFESCEQSVNDRGQIPDVIMKAFED